MKRNFWKTIFLASAILKSTVPSHLLLRSHRLVCLRRIDYSVGHRLVGLSSAGAGRVAKHQPGWPPKLLTNLINQKIEYLILLHFHLATCSDVTWAAKNVWTIKNVSVSTDDKGDESLKRWKECFSTKMIVLLEKNFKVVIVINVNRPDWDVLCRSERVWRLLRCYNEILSGKLEIFSRNLRSIFDFSLGSIS